MSSRLALLALWPLAALGVVGATAAAAALNARLGATSGLQAQYATTPGTSLHETERAISRSLPDRLARRFNGQPFTAEWSGYLIVPAAATYRFAIPADDEAQLELDSRPVADAKMQLGPPVTLRRGLHDLRMRYADYGGVRHLALLWARGDGALYPVPPLLLVPELRSGAEVRHRVVLVTAAPLIPWMMLALLLPILAAAVRRSWGVVGAGPHTGGGTLGLRLLLLGAAALFAAGSWWGVPAHGTWAPDEVMPADVQYARELRFAGGWAGIYPPLHYVVLSLFHLPHALAAAAGLIDLTALRATADLLLISRLVSTAMALGILLIAWEIGREHFGSRAGLFAAAVLAVSLPLTYYAKTANLDVPYVFWLTLSLLFYLRCFRRGAPLDFHLFGVAGAAAICTKDQAYGFYVLPALYMGGASLIYAHRPARPAGVPPLRTLGTMAATTLGAFVIFWNLPFNLEGFQEHVRLIAGPASEGFRMYPNSPGGHLRLFTSALLQMALAMSPPLAIGAACSIWAALRSRQRTLCFLLLPAVSYYLCFISVVMYHYDRFFLGIIVIASIATGWWLQQWTAAEGTSRRWKLALVTAALLYAGSRGIALDVLMLRDARYDVERRLREVVLPHQHVAATGSSLYLPRPGMWPTRRMEADLEALHRTRPDFVVRNAAYARRFPPGSPAGRFHDALESGRAGYRLGGRYRTAIPFSPLALEGRFREVREDEFSNLTKVNPAIEIYVRD